MRGKELVDTLKQADLLTRVRLYEDGVEGADTALQDVLDHSRSTLVLLLGVSSTVVDAVYREPDPIKALAALTSACLRGRNKKRKEAHALCGARLQTYLRWSYRREEVEYPPEPLIAQLKTFQRPAIVAFGSFGCVELRVLRDVLGFCHGRRCRITAAILNISRAHFTVYYETRWNTKGNIRLWLQPTQKKRRIYILPTEPKTPMTEYTVSCIEHCVRRVTINVPVGTDFEKIIHLAEEADDDWDSESQGVSHFEVWDKEKLVYKRNEEAEQDAAPLQSRAHAPKEEITEQEHLRAEQLAKRLVDLPPEEMAVVIAMALRDHRTGLRRSKEPA